MLEFKNVSFKYENDCENIIDHLSFTVEKGEFISIIGVSGCGKSTIFRLINRLLSPSSGEIIVNQSPIVSCPKRSTSIPGYMPQKDLLFPWRTIEKNLWIPMELRHLSREEMRRRSDAVLKDMGLFNYRAKYPKDLSGGMRQRISFARTLLTDSELMLLDEPFSALDSLTRMAMQEWLLAQWEHFHKTILFITHDVEEAIFLSKKIFVVTKRPIQSLEVVEVPAVYPRSREILKQPEMIELKEQLISQLRKQVNI